MAFKDRSEDYFIERSRVENIHLIGIFQAGLFPQQLHFFVIVITFECCFSCQQSNFFTVVYVLLRIRVSSRR